MARRKKKSHRKTRNVGLISLGVGVDIMDDLGYLIALDRLQGGRDIDDALIAIGQRTNLSSIVKTSIKGAVLGGLRSNMGSVPIFRGKKTTISLFGR